METSDISVIWAKVSLILSEVVVSIQKYGIGNHWVHPCLSACPHFRLGGTPHTAHHQIHGLIHNHRHHTRNCYTLNHLCNNRMFPLLLLKAIQIGFPQLKRKLERKYSRIDDNYNNLEQKSLDWGRTPQTTQDMENKRVDESVQGPSPPRVDRFRFAKMEHNSLDQLVKSKSAFEYQREERRLRKWREMIGVGGSDGKHYVRRKPRVNMERNP
ncbi:hypothetical protein L6452_05492 [Arctium lappa]|uniref:Uncharacterized protein n=1 Tax=Arctium lappa TaxID=4217 RepID=A0ACB9EH94_ARCLA|nr:hypothetical protein L6452_05492 [Arctium lappa]